MWYSSIAPLKSHINMSLVGAIAQYIASGFMIFGGVVPYVPQYIEIKKSGNAEGFSTFVCLTLLIANILRILFWFGRHYELPLLVQSIVMITAMLIMMQLCVSVKGQEIIRSGRPNRFTDSRVPNDNGKHFLDFERKYFWRWTDFGSYLQFLSIFTLMMTMVTYKLISFTIYIELLGFLAVLSEALLGAPQFYRNFRNKSTTGMSVSMVLMWTSGDIFKTGYFIVRQAPAQFTICGTLQVCIDLAIMCQVIFYKYVYTTPAHNR